MKKIKQTAGRTELGAFAPEFARLNDDVLFGEVWSGEELSAKMRSVITISALVSKGITDSSLGYHVETARKNGVSGKELAALLTQLAFYAGWPNAWAAFRIAKDIYAGDDDEAYYGGMFGLGAPNDAYKQYFVGRSYLNPLTDAGTVQMANVTFEPGCRNNWHIHKADKGGGQILLCTSGRGWYKEWDKPARTLKAGDVVTIPAGVKHWHGAAADSWFSHVAVEVPGENNSTVWLERVADDEYQALQD